MPGLRDFTAVALGPGYECHACGREFAAGLVRVPRAWGAGGEAIAEAAALPLPYPEAAVVEEDTLGDQKLALAAELPERPLVLGGCCCTHVGAVEGLAARHDRLALVWLDAHGDLNTPETSPSGNLWGMPLRMILDSGAVAPKTSRSSAHGTSTRPRSSTSPRSACAPDPTSSTTCSPARTASTSPSTSDSLDPSEISAFMPEPGGLTLDEVEQSLLRRVAVSAPVLGAGFTALLAGPPTLEPSRARARARA